MAKDEKAPYFYRPERLAIAFGIVFFLCLGFVAWATFDDHSREWKETQRAFRARMVERLDQRLEAQAAASDSTALAEVEGRIAAEEDSLVRHRDRLQELGRQIAEVQRKRDGLELEYRNLEAVFGSIQYEYELARHEESASVERLEKEYAERRERLDGLREKRKAYQQEADELERKRAGMLASRDRAHKERESLLRERVRLQGLLAKYQSGLVKAVLNAPLLDFIQPTERIEQIVLDDVREDLNFVHVQTVDRCATCHRGIDRPGFEGEAQPFKTHPRIDLFVGDSSPHPGDRFGCTVCHGGRGRALSFVSTAHTPRDRQQEEEWIERYDWHELEHFDHPMASLPHVESSCLKCHEHVRHVPEAPKLNRGRDIFFRHGCYGCHETRGYNDLPKLGPELNAIARKADPVWVYNWLLNPRGLRATTVMPEFFGQSNQVSHERDRLEAAAISSYLFARSQSGEYPSPPPGGEAESGKRLFETVGCLGCHAVGGGESTFGPNLQDIGVKTTPAWIYSWIRDPRSYSQVARMPDLRLTEAEAADITAYLTTLSGPPLPFAEVPAVEEAAVEEALVEFLSVRGSVSDARARIGGWSRDEKISRLGRHLIASYGCFGCHEIEDFRDYPKIGTSLSQEGSKPVDRLEFGFLGHQIGMTRAAFFRQKMADPRAFDRDRARRPLDRLLMPNFSFDEEEIEALTIHLLSLTDDEMPETIRRKLDIDEILVEEGEWLIAVTNCRGCHAVDGEGGEIYQYYDDRALAPPALLQEGRKVQPLWLNLFLKRPSALRPWLAVRMPSFGMDDETQHVIIDYFEAKARETRRIAYYDPGLVAQATHEAGREAFEVLKCRSCHPTGADNPEGTPDSWGPDLALAQKRLKPGWLIDWFRNPQAVQPGTKMPNFFFDYDPDYDEYEELLPDAKQWMHNVRDYLMTMERSQVSRQ